MANKYTVKMDKLELKEREATFERLMPTLEKALNVVMERHGKLYARGRQPDGSPQKLNSGDYRRRKRSPGVYAGRQRFTGRLPTVLTGAMHNSRTVKRRARSVIAVYTGQSATGSPGSKRKRIGNARKAAFVRGKGYKFHYLSKQDVEIIDERVAEQMGKMMSRIVSVRKNRALK